jgi:hypothetical protein
MVRRRRDLRLEWSDLALERRELLSHAGLAKGAAAHHSSAPVGTSLFHHNGINGLSLDASFVNRMNDRLGNSAAQTTRVTQAFDVFAASFSQLPVSPPPGYGGPTLSSLLAYLTRQVDYALSVREILTDSPTPSQASGLRVSPLAQRALVPYANAQITQLGNTLASTPPNAGAGGALVQPSPTAAVNTAVNAILNALAESSLHPNLFTSPSDFYISPDVQFTTDFSGAPAQSSPGYFVRGPHGNVLPGAPPRPHVRH